MPPVVSELNIYPIKSCRGLSLPSAEVEERGFRFDRSWMLTDESGIFLSQRKVPAMALVEVALGSGQMTVAAPGMDRLVIPMDPEPAAPVQTTIWRDVVQAHPYDEQTDLWFSAFLGLPCHLVKFNTQVRRIVDTRYANRGEHTAFSDGYPFLAISEASLADLNSRLERPLPMNRFRPNIVLSGCEAFAEDTWRAFRIGPVTFRAAKPCARCRITTIDQLTGMPAEEPLRTLSLYRSRGSSVLFGQNLLHSGSGSIAVGDVVHLLDQGNADGN